ncbi:MAG: protease SohB [Saccharospirillum sp.]
MWSDYLLFLLKALTVLIVLVVLVVAVARAGRGGSASGPAQGKLVVRRINDDLHKLAATIREQVLDKKALKAQHKKDKERDKSESGQIRARMWVMQFKGDIQASQVDGLRREVNALLQVAEGSDEVVVLIESPGGAVSGYGLAASQLARIREAGLKLTVCVDKVAASGGYMMACVADRIIAAPFAMLGSIGVLAQVPNIHQLLKRHDVDVEVLTAGRHKAPLTLMGEKTEEGREKFLQDLQAIHQRFKQLVGRYRPQLDLAKVAEGDFWLAEDALELGLVDDIQTSDAYLLPWCETRDVISLRWQPKQKLENRLKKILGGVQDDFFNRLFRRWLP